MALQTKWQGLSQCASGGRSILWGTIQGSGAAPYRCQVELGGPEFCCTCPSKKRPCKHSLGLFLLFVSQPDAFETASLPDWVAAWIAKKDDEAAKKATRAEGRGPSTTLAESERKNNQRAAGRDKKIRAGLDDLEIWLFDLLRQGLAAAQAQSTTFWETAAARLVDAQAAGLARWVRAMPGLASSGEGWQDRLLDQIARLYLAIEGYRRIESLNEETQVDLRSLVGINIRQQDLLDGPGVSDTWLVIGRGIEEEANLVVQRTWLWGKTTSRPAMVLSFSAGGGTLDTSLVPGTSLPADLVFFPGAYPLRAIVRGRGPVEEMPADIPGAGGIVEATQGYAAALACYPWLERFPLMLSGATPFTQDGDWFVADGQGRQLQLARRFLHPWTLLAMSGGRPLGIFGEWNGERLLPLSTWAEGVFFAFPGNPQ